jgi:Uma2 family endonuclease
VSNTRVSIAALMPRRYHAIMPPVVEARAGNAPAPLRFTRAEYKRMAEAGVFEARRVELLDGEVIAMTPQGSAHASAVARIVRTLTGAFGERASIRPQLPLVLDDASEPEPDVVVCRPDPRDYSDRHPGPSDVLLVVEVSDNSLAYDRGPKAAAYARSGIPVLWIVNVAERSLETFQEPEPGLASYRRRGRHDESEIVALPEAASIPVSALLPPR